MEKFKNVGELMFLSRTFRTYHATITSISKRRNTVSAAIALGKVKGKLLKLKNKDVNDFNQIKTMRKYIKELEDGKVEYKTVSLKNIEAELKTLNVRKVKR